MPDKLDSSAAGAFRTFHDRQGVRLLHPEEASVAREESPPVAGEQLVVADILAEPERQLAAVRLTGEGIGVDK